jgi:hypothetical protein
MVKRPFERFNLIHHHINPMQARAMSPGRKEGFP